MKRIYVLFFFICSLLFFNKLNAINGYTTGTAISVRTGAGVNFDKLATISSKNTLVSLVNDTLYNVGDNNCSTGWYKIYYNSREAYVCGVYISIGNIESPIIPEYNTESFDARIYATIAYVRTSPSTGSTLMDSLITGTNIKVLQTGVEGNGCSEGWDLISYYNDRRGYVCSIYVKSVGDLTLEDDEYKSTLISYGFPESYTPYLNYLHKLHPTWSFIPVITNLYWDDVVNGEANVAYNSTKNLIQTNIDAYRLSNIPAEGNDWFSTTSQVNAFYLDPRNFLTEKFIFMFENLNYQYSLDDVNSVFIKETASSKSYYSYISNMLGNSYLNTDEYIYYFIEAGFLYNISPVHLVSRVIQEGGSNDTYEAITGISSRFYGSYPLYGYYNYYNIGAYSDDITNSPVLRGLAYACGPACGFYDTYGRPWTDRKKAIYGGAYFLADGYINSGQNTRYFQKFNTNTTYPYTHQYMGNVLAPSAESATAYYAYVDSNNIENPFVFNIPIYSNMPVSVSLPNIASDINSLSSIKINDALINGYDSDILEYTVYVLSSIDSINISTVKEDSKSNVLGDGIVNITETNQNVNINVVSESGNLKTYIIHVVKVNDTTSVNDILENLSVKVNDDLIYNISPGTLISTIKQSVNKKSPLTEVNITNSGNVESDNTILKTGQTIKISVPSGEVRSFNIVVNGDINGDGEITILDLLKVQKHLLNSSVLLGANKLASDTNQDGEVTILDLLRIQKAILGQLSL